MIWALKRLFYCLKFFGGMSHGFAFVLSAQDICERRTVLNMLKLIWIYGPKIVPNRGS